MARARQTAKVRAALSRGAAGGVHRRLRRGFSFAAIQDWLLNAFGITEPTDQQEIASLGQDILQAGLSLESAPPGVTLPPNDYPLIRGLSQSILEGGRYVHEIIIPWHDPQSGASGEWFWRVRSDEELSMEALQSIAEDLGGESSRTGSPPAAGAVPGADLEIGPVQEVGPFRGF